MTMNRRDSFVQIADYTQLPAGSDVAPYYLYLHDGFDHGTYGQRDARMKAFSSAVLGGAPAAGTILQGTLGEDMRFLSVGDVVYFRNVVNAKNNAGNQRNLWDRRSITASAANGATMHAAVTMTAAQDLFYRKLKSGPLTDLDGWIGVQDAQELSLHVYVHSGGPVTVTKQYSDETNSPSGQVNGDRPISQAVLVVAAGAGEYYRQAGPLGRVRFAFQGATPSIVTASLMIRRGL